MGLFGDLAKLAVGYALSEMENAKTVTREKDILKLIVFYYGFGLDLDKDIKGRIARLISHLCEKQYSVDILETEINSIHAYINKEITSLFFKNMSLLNGEYKYFAESIFYYCSMQSLVLGEEEADQYFYNLYLLKKYFKFNQNVLYRVADTIISKEEMFGDSVDEIADTLEAITDKNFIKNMIKSNPSIKTEIEDVKYDFQDGVLTCSGFGAVTRDWMVTVYGKNMDKEESSIRNPRNKTVITKVKIYSDNQIKKIVINEGITGIEDGSFYKCTSLINVSILNGITSIDDNAFGYCSLLTSINIPNSVTSIGKCAFNGCSSLVSMDIPNSVTKIGEEAFRDCESLTKVVIPNSITSISKSLFSLCSSLTSINIPNNVTDIGESAFYGCSSLTSINIPNGVTNIGDYVFEFCESFTTVDIPTNITSIGEWAFANCKSLTSINIPNSITSIGDNAFYECKMLKTVNYGGTKNEWKAIKKGDICINDKIVVIQGW